MSTKHRQFMQWQSAIVKFFYPYIKTDRIQLATLAVISVVTTAANAFLIWMLGVAISQLTESRFTQLNQTLIIIAGVVLFNQIVNFIYSYKYQRVTLRFVDRVRGQLLNHIMCLSFPVLSSYSKGDLISRLANDVDQLLSFMVNVPLSLFSNIVVLSVYMSVLFWIDWQLTLISATLAPLFFLSQYFVAPKTGRVSRHFVRERAELITMEEQILGNLKNISSFGSETLLREKHRRQFDVARYWALKVRKIRVTYSAFFTFLIYFAGVVVVYSGISNIKSGQLTVGVLVSFLVYIRNLAGPVRSIAHYPIQLQANRAAADRVMEVMNTKSYIEDNDSKPDLMAKQGNIVFDNVCFSYPQRVGVVFSRLSVTIRAGETVALVGASGAGKSTFAVLLLRFYDPQTGRIAIDSVDIKSVSLASLRKQISVVWQEPFIINGSIKENLLLARPDATEEQIISACKSSFAWEFIEKLEHGLDTEITANGASLSVGQTQRLAIAQAFLRDTPILILDEASSALDSYSERMIVEALQSLRKNRTTLIIAHRYSSIRTADRILYFNGNGSITSGTHDELMASHRGYSDAFNWQLSPPKSGAGTAAI